MDDLASTDLSRLVTPRSNKLLGPKLALFVLFPLVTLVYGNPAGTTTMSETRKIATKASGSDSIKVVFSDLDGTLLHYPTTMPKIEPGNKLLHLPPSSTGMQGIISSRTLALVKEVRTKGGKFVLVSGMRTSTFLHRVPFLPRADAYCTESGGRIFYPTTLGGEGADFEVLPESYDGCTPEDLEPFGLVEDREWRKQMEEKCGNYGGLSLDQQKANPEQLPALNERDGQLWDFAKHLDSKGFVLDIKGYSTCFRVNKKHQQTVTDDDFIGLSDGRVKPWDGLSTSVNLSCVDFYPGISGKKNCCRYLVEKLCDTVDNEQPLQAHALCICDDDNDIEMAKACHHAFIPDVSSQTMKETIDEDPNHFTQTGGEGLELEGTKASEAALTGVLKYF